MRVPSTSSPIDLPNHFRFDLCTFGVSLDISNNFNGQSTVLSTALESLRYWHSMTRPKVPMPTSRRSRNRWSTMVPGPPRKCPTVSSRDEVEELRWLGSSGLTLLRRGDLAAASVELRRRRSFRPWRDRRLPRRRRLGVSEWFRRRS